jgi:pantoate--beta-alanine ligase
MKEIADLLAMRTWSREQRARGKRVGFVPTMGSLHEGHLRLVDTARAEADVVAMSIFVNPLQFGPQEDFARYPRDLARDRSLAGGRGVDCLFAPEVSAVYPRGSAEAKVTAGALGDVLEGEVRPGHFAGVLTVVAKLFNVVEPDVAVFGRKDIQQAALIRRMVADLDFPVRIVVAPTVRELDGLALSSRNAFLDADGRRAALALSRALRTVEQAWRGGASDPRELEKRGREVLDRDPGVKAQYFALVDPESFRPAARADAKTVACTAAVVGTTRLIDNIILGEGVRDDVHVGA